MNYSRWIYSAFVVSATAFFSGCSKEPKAPTPMAVEEAPKTLDKNFEAASAPSKQLATEANAAINSKNYGQAMESLQNLQNRTDLSAQQQQAAAKSMQAVNKRLSEQAAAGDPVAQEILKKRRASK